MHTKTIGHFQKILKKQKKKRKYGQDHYLNLKKNKSYIKKC